MKKKTSLMDAVSTRVRKRVADVPQGATRGPPSRQGRVNVTAYLPPQYRQRLLLIQAKNPTAKIQHLLQEALDDLFEKHGVVGGR